MRSTTAQLPQRGGVPRSTAIFSRVTGRRADPVDDYNNVIWALAKKFTASPEEMEAAASEIFHDMQRYAVRPARTDSLEDRLIAKIAWRRLLRFLQ